MLTKSDVPGWWKRLERNALTCPCRVSARFENKCQTYGNYGIDIDWVLNILRMKETKVKHAANPYHHYADVQASSKNGANGVL